ncbi:MAG: aspartate/glutamate racemase family protein, partial [Chitinophagaceae bacterium]|nr:aspartate/glutamate racemase family protein [Chitinophagaceae bacterium]
YINNSIYEEMGRGLFLPETKAGYLAVIDKYTTQGIDGVIMGCTEIPLLLSADDSHLPLFDTTRIHARAAVDYVLKS